MKFGQYILFIGFLLIIFTFGTLSFFEKDRKLSDLENRNLAQKPVKDPKLIWSGKYFKQYESYFSDQFFGRDKWVEQYTKLQMNITPVYVNGYHVTKNHTILQQPTTVFPKEEIEWVGNSVNELGSYLKKRGTKFYFFSLPSKTNVFSDFLPSYAPKSHMKENANYLLSQLHPNVVTAVNMQEEYKKYNDETIRSYYYKTDHHWTIKGAFPAYQLIMKTIEKDFPTISRDYGYENYKYMKLDGFDFMGTWNKQLARQIDISGEVVDYYEPKQYSFEDYIIYQQGNKKSRIAASEIYGKAKKRGKKEINYEDIYTKNYREYTIENPKSTNDLKVLLVKDSYMNAITLHMAHHFKETTVYDVRFNNDRSLYDYLQTHQFDMVILGYNDTYVSVKKMYDFSNTMKK